MHVGGNFVAHHHVSFDSIHDPLDDHEGHWHVCSVCDDTKNVLHDPYDDTKGRSDVGSDGRAPSSEAMISCVVFVLVVLVVNVNPSSGLR